jgi:uncharacterized protein with beta-barrel porin domain
MFNNHHKQFFIVSLLFSITLLSSQTKALYDVNNTGVSDVYGLSGDAVRPAIGSEFGSVRATADTNNAYGLYGNGGNIEISGDFPAEGTIYAKAGNNNAYGLYIDVNNTITTGNINGSITAEAGNNYAYGLYCDNLSSITIGNINGIITATAGNNGAYGLYSKNMTDGIILCGGVSSNTGYSSLNIGAINGSIISTAENGDAYGLFSMGSMTTGAINGNIIANGNLNACGLCSSSNSITTGDIKGIIYALATNGACGLGAYGSITTGDIGGTIFALGGNAGASCFSCFFGPITTGAITGTIIASGNGASCFSDCNGDITTGNINGTISANSGTNNALVLDGHSITTGNINGTITSIAENNNAWCMRGGPITTSDINGTISATAGTNYAYGLYMWHPQRSVTTGSIRGTISAHAGGDYAYGILSWGPIDIKVDGGTISAIADNGIHVAAIQSGKGNAENFVNTWNADDRVEIVSGSTIIGDIDLGMYGSDNDILTLSGINTKSTTFNDDLKNIETINITGGRWNINSTISNSTNGINMTGGILGGTGTLNSLNVTGGTLAPGNSIGTTNINGDLTLGSDSTLEIEVDNSGNSDKLIVTGNANINGGTLKAISTETITNSQEYTIIEAQKVSGRFDVVDTALLDTTLSDIFVGQDYLADSVILRILPERFDNPEMFITGNQRSLGSAMQQIAGGGGNEITTELQQLTNITDLRNAYNQLCGQTVTSLAPVSIASNIRFTETVTNRLRNARSAASYGFDDSVLFAMAGQDRTGKTVMSDTDAIGDSFALGNGTPYFTNQKWGIWGRGYTIFGDREAQTDMTGYQYTILGTSFGMDYKFTDELLFGVTAGFADGRMNYFSSRDNSVIHSMPIGIYGSWNKDSGYLDSILSYTPAEYKTHRYVDLTSEKLTGEFDGYDISEYLEAGYSLYRSERYLVQPLASFQVSYLNTDSFTETGGTSSLSFGDQSYESYKGSLGAKVIRLLGKETKKQSSAVELRGRWSHEFGDTKSNVNANFADQPGALFTISDRDLPRDSAVLGIGFKTKVKENAKFFIDYDTSINKSDTSQILSAGFEYRW